MKHFKQIATLLIVLISSVMVSCSDEPQNTAIVGTWKYVVTEEGWSGKNEVGITYTFTKKGRVTCRMWVYKNGKKTSDDEYNFSYTFDGKSVTLKDSSGSSVTYKVTISRNQMTMDGRTYTKQ
ncbi:MAG: hypothetical protein HDS75_07990 [Bacteroidales bacterium]|nr:hypothetical protein [Bacteroidales bacterium]